MELNWIDIGKRIKVLREGKGFTQTDLASRIGKTESSVRKYESGLVEIPLSVLSKIAEIGESSLVQLLGLGKEISFSDEFALEEYLKMSEDEFFKDLSKLSGFFDYSAYKEWSEEEKLQVFLTASKINPGLFKLKRFLANHSEIDDSIKAEVEDIFMTTDKFYGRVLAYLSSKIGEWRNKSPKK